MRCHSAAALAPGRVIGLATAFEPVSLASTGEVDVSSAIKGGMMGICAALLCLSMSGVMAPAGGASFASTLPGEEALAAAVRAAPLMALQGSTAAVTDDASRVQFSIYGGKLYFRNLNQFNPDWSGCCYNYYIDLTTDDGKSMYAYFMMQFANRARVVFWRGSTAPGPIEQMGNWG